MKLPPLNVLLFDEKYARSNCYISQILETLENDFRVNRIYIHKRNSFKKLISSPYPVLSLLQARILLQKRLEILSLIESSKILIYDQDPWESFIDTGSIKGSYEEFIKVLNVDSFLVTSKWWAKNIRAFGFPVEYVQMGVLKRLHSKNVDFGSRKVPIFFQGTLHDYRKDFFGKLTLDNVDVDIRHSEKYSKFLKNLRKAKIFLHISPQNWKINNQLVYSNCCWIKDLEAVSQGCISIRNRDDEYYLQEIDRIPAIETFVNPVEIKDILHRIDAISLKEIKGIIEESKFFVSENMNWKQIVNIVRDHAEPKYF